MQESEAAAESMEIQLYSLLGSEELKARADDIEPDRLARLGACVTELSMQKESGGTKRPGERLAAAKAAIATCEAILTALSNLQATAPCQKDPAWNALSPAALPPQEDTGRLETSRPGSRATPLGSRPGSRRPLSRATGSRGATPLALGSRTHTPLALSRPISRMAIQEESVAGKDTGIDDVDPELKAKVLANEKSIFAQMSRAASERGGQWDEALSDEPAAMDFGPTQAGGYSKGYVAPGE